MAGFPSLLKAEEYSVCPVDTLNALSFLSPNPPGLSLLSLVSGNFPNAFVAPIDWGHK